MTTRPLKTTDIELASSLGQTVATLLLGTSNESSESASIARSLAKRLGDVAMGLLTPPAAEVQSAPIDLVAARAEYDKGTRPTLQQYLAADVRQNVIDHTIRSRILPTGELAFYIHPASASGGTLDFILEGNTVRHA